MQRNVPSTSNKGKPEHDYGKQKVISEEQAKIIATTLGGGADPFKQWGLSAPASDF
jgi:hypothetical protein